MTFQDPYGIAHHEAVVQAIELVEERNRPHAFAVTKTVLAHYTGVVPRHEMAVAALLHHQSGVMEQIQEQFGPRIISLYGSFHLDEDSTLWGYRRESGIITLACHLEKPSAGSRVVVDQGKLFCAPLAQALEEKVALLEETIVE